MDEHDLFHNAKVRIVVAEVVQLVATKDDELIYPAFAACPMGWSEL